MIPEKVDVLYSKYGLEWYERSIRQELCNLTRDKCKMYDMDPLTNDNKVSQEINEYVKLEGNKIIKEMGIPIVIKSVNIGGVNPPDEVTAERSKTAAAAQKQKTIDQETQNQISRQASEKERAKADRAYQDALGLTTSQYIFLQELRVREIAANKAETITFIEGSNAPTLTREVK